VSRVTGLEVDHQLELGRLFDRQVGWPLPRRNGMTQRASFNPRAVK